MKKPLVTYKQEMAPGEYATVIVGKELRALIQWLERAADRLEAGSA